jgi:hypothetical protein
MSKNHQFHSFFVGEYPPSLGIVALQKSRCHMPLDCVTQGKNSRARYGTLIWMVLKQLVLP